MTPSLAPILASLINLASPDAFVVALILIPFPAWMVIDCITKEPDVGSNRIVWLFVILLIPMGSLIYFFARKLTRRSSPPAL